MPKELNVFERNAKRVVLFAVFCGGLSPVLTKLIEAPPIAIGFYRLTMALPFFLIMVLGWHRNELKSISKKEFISCVIGGLFLAGHFFSWFTAIKLTTIASASVLGMTHPIIILLISTLFMHQKTNKKAIIGILVAFTGAIIISGGDYSLSMDAIIGDIFAILAAIFMALYLMVGQKVRKTVNAAVYVFLVFTSTWLTFTVGMFATSTPFSGYSLSDFMWLFLMALFCQIGAHAVFNWLLGHVDPLYIATWENAEAVIATALAVIIFSEIPAPWQLVGGGIVILGLIYYTRHEQT